MNILDKYRLPLFAADVEAGNAGADSAPPPPSAPEKLSIRESLERGFEDARKTQEPPREAKKSRAEDGKFKKGTSEPAKRAADEMREATETDETPAAAADGGTAPEAAPEGETVPEAGTKPEVAAPAAWTKEAKAAWAELPPAVQQAVVKREADVQKGVDELKAKYADIDQALAPHIPVIRQHGHTPAQAVNQLFAWFQALAVNPDAAFPALQKCFNWQPQTAPAQAQPGAAAAAAPSAAEQPAGEIPVQVQQYINQMRQELDQIKQGFGQQLGSMQQTFASQQEAKTQEILANWAKDKPHFEKVRGLMAQLIASGAVPLKEGRVDLDGAYTKAVRLDDDVFTQMQQAEVAKKDAEMKAAAAAKKKADEDAAKAAKAASASLTPNAPGSAPGAHGKPKKGRSVRETLLDAIGEARAT